MFVPVPSQDLDFQCHMSCFSMFNDLWRDVSVRFVDIGDIVDHYCLNFLLFC